MQATCKKNKPIDRREEFLILSISTKISSLPGLIARKREGIFGKIL
jgi:hypothetical protein